MKPSLAIFFRRALLCLLVYYGATLAGNTASAQNMITVMTDQIAKLELYLQEAKKGYTIVQSGLNTISQIKKGDLDLHSLFFSSLSTVNPAIKNWGKVADIIAMESQIFIGCSTTLTKLLETNAFTAQDVQYITAVYSNVKTLSSKDVDELTKLITDGNWQMSDDERMSKIDRLFNAVRQKYSFLISLANRLSAEAQNRSSRKIDLQNILNFFKP